MKRRISEILNQNGPDFPVSVVPDASVFVAVELMNLHSTGSVLICAQSRLVGILTERDVLSRVLGAGRDAATTAVRDVMTSSPLEIGREATLGDAIRLMRDANVAHLPVVDHGVPVGVVSMHDLILAFARDLRVENEQLLTYVHGPTGTTMESIF